MIRHFFLPYEVTPPPHKPDAHLAPHPVITILLTVGALPLFKGKNVCSRQNGPRKLSTPLSLEPVHKLCYIAKV